MRPIDADALKEQVESPYTEYPIMIQIRKALKDFIDAAPTIDAVPVADHYEILLAEKAGSWKEGFDAGIKAERRHNETFEELARNGFQEDERSEE